LTSHILRCIPEIRFIHIVRHPCASLFSWLNNPLEFPHDADPLQEWRSGSCRKDGPGEFWGYDDWKKVTKQAIRFTDQYPSRYRIIRYEDLVAASEVWVKKLFQYFNLRYCEQTKRFLLQSHSRHDNHRRSVFKDPKVINKWVQLLDPKIVAEILNELKGTDLEKFTLS